MPGHYGSHKGKTDKKKGKKKPPMKKKGSK